MTRAAAATVAGLAGLVALSLILRTGGLGTGFWIDEALSVGIADRPLAEIPGALRLDGSPPLYYALLHVWMRVLGDRSEEATHVLSLVLALATVPVAWALARSVLGARAGWAAAVLAAVNPFLSQYAQETRMYALVILLATVACGTFAGGFVLGRGRAWLVAFAAALAALLYTHNWGLFFAAAAGAVWLGLVLRERGDERRRLLERGLVTFGAAALVYAPWIPTLLFQAAHTGAPWARAPVFENLARVPEVLIGSAALAALAVAGVVAAPRLRATREGAMIAALLAIAAGTLAFAWVTSQVSPAWATRYLAIALAPLLLAAAGLVAYAGRSGLAALAVAALASVVADVTPSKSNVRLVARSLEPALRSGDLVISTQPEQVPALAYYLQDVEGLRWATLTGPLQELGVTDWRDGVQRLRRTSPARHLAPLLDAAPLGSRVALVEPEIFDIGRWSAPWTSLVRIRSAEWRAWMLDDERFRVVAVRPEAFSPPAPNPVRVTLFLKADRT